MQLVKNYFISIATISIDETDWSMQIAEEIFNAEFECPGCSQIFNFTNIQKLQHTASCKKKTDEKEPPEEEMTRPTSSNQKLFKCSLCLKHLHLTNVEILKHKKSCKIKDEKQ